VPVSFESNSVNDAGELARLGYDARIGRVDAIDVGKYLAFVGTQCGCDRDTGRIRSAAAQRGDVAVGVDALKACDHDHAAFSKIGANVRVVDREDACFRECAVGENFYLPAGVAFRLQPKRLQRECE
jgi:hypothetical protein